MNIVGMLCECLEQKKQQMEEYERCTNEMCGCELDALEQYIIRREELANTINRIDAEIEGLCETSFNQELLHDAIHNHGSYGDFPTELIPLYDIGADLYSIMNRIYAQNLPILARMEQQREAIKEKIKGGSQTAQVYNYVKNLASPQAKGIYLGDKI